MFKMLIFGGTTEGRLLAEFCADNKICADISVTTDYGAELLPNSEYVKILTGRLDSEQMKSRISKGKYTLIIDATHPYAVIATENIRAVCAELKMPYYRLLRENICVKTGIFLNDLNELIEYLNGNKKTILCTLGSKELPKLTAVKGFAERMWIRVLPADGIEAHCTDLGFDKNKIILGKGPFSVEENIRHIRLSGAEILVTKESGKTGGYPEKVCAAKECEIELVTIKRPAESGFEMAEMQKIILGNLV